MTDDPRDIHTYPAPTIVLGLGRFGLAVVERLADDWEALRVASRDTSLKNLRLLHLRPDDDGTSAGWRVQERQVVQIARHVGDGDLPTHAVDLLFLRSLGLVRYHNGIYQVAAPEDRGHVADNRGRPVRLRYFTWHDLDPDPLRCVEALSAQRERISALDLFVTPLLNRIRQGHSPRTVLAAISRCRALAEGRDPSPWPWLSAAVGAAAAEAPRDAVRLNFARAWLAQADLDGALEGLAPAPLEGWRAWHQRWRHAPDAIDMTDEARPPNLDIYLPAAFAPTPRDLMAAAQPRDLLRADWQNSGWAGDELQFGRDAEFRPIQVSAFRLGLFDHDRTSRVHRAGADHFRERLTELAQRTHRGLVRMWVDLQREHSEQVDASPSTGRWHDQAHEAVAQSLELLGELLVRPLTSVGPPELDEDRPAERDDSRVDGERLPLEPTPNLEDLVVDESEASRSPRHVLARRLEALGFAQQAEATERRMLFRQLRLTPRDVNPTPRSQSSADPAPISDGLLALRRTLNAKTRQLFDFDFLKTYRHRPVKKPPRLTIFVVGDAGEAFTRASINPVLRELHAELLRAYGPIFESYREGFDRALSVVPILWTPHPADAFGGGHPEQNRLEEAAIIESLQSLRRWVETIPRGDRCIPQVFVNSRVTGNAVLSVWDAVRQTRDFFNFQARNDLSADPWLRRTAVGQRGEDVLASFTCHEIEFPARRARQYVANRFARASLERLQSGERVDSPEVNQRGIEPPSGQALLREPVQRLDAQIRQVADDIADQVSAIGVSRDATVDELLAGFDEGLERRLKSKIADRWQTLTDERGGMDAMVGELRRKIADELDASFEAIEREGDRLIAEHASKGGLPAARAGFNLLHDLARDQLQDHEAQRADSEARCAQHRIPDYHAIEAARQGVLDESQQKPAWSPMKLGVVAWALMAPALGAPLCWTAAKLMDLHLAPNAAELLLGPWGPWTGALALLLPAIWLLVRHMDRRVAAIQRAVEGLREAARGVVEGGPGSAPSVRSFFESRLRHTGELAVRNYANNIYQTVLEDRRRVAKLSRSIDLQRERLLRRAEALGVRTEMPDDTSDPGAEDIGALFEAKSSTPIDKLISPESLVDYYTSKIRDERELSRRLPGFIEGSGGLKQWRKSACLADTDHMLDYSARQFAEITNKPLIEQIGFAAEARARLIEFVARHFTNTAFGAQFNGYEGLDPDGIHVMARTSLVMHPALRAIFEQARQEPENRARTRTLDVIEADLAPNAAYMLSLARGIRPQSARNLRRYESFHDRPAPPDGRIFWPEGDTPINKLTGYEALKTELRDDVRSLVSQPAAPSPPALAGPENSGGDDAP